MADVPPDGADEVVGRPRRVLFICADPVGERMAGLGIRCWELARALARDAEVTVAHGGTSEGPRDGVLLAPHRPHAPAALRPLIERADTVVSHPQWPLVNRWLGASRARIVIDLYCPETLETLELFAGGNARVRRQMTATTLDRLHAALRIGHNFICASDTQRDLWLGSMLAMRLISPERYDHDPSMRDVIDLVPFGVPDEPPAGNGTGPREAIPQLGADNEIVLWNGGIWNWLDAGTAIRAAGELATRRPSVKLVFMGGGAQQSAAAGAQAAHALAQELGLLGSTVHFHDAWIPYAERGAWLTQASCAVSAHAEHLESRFAYRTRVLDCFWAGLPVVCTSGDDLAERVTLEDLGAVVPPEDSVAMAAALERVLDRGRDSYAARLQAAADRQTWPRVAEPLARWIALPTPAERLGDSPEALRLPIAQRLREAAYLAGGRAILAHRAAAGGR
jgi:glycosyltransferase involved in cell wall biosynthesis